MTPLISQLDRCFNCGARPRNICPAMDKGICPSCCGSMRGSSIACASGCAYFPFAVPGYDLWLKTDSALARKMLSRIKECFGQNHFENWMHRMSFEDDSLEHMMQTAAASAAYNILFIERSAKGLSPAREWKEEGWPGLSNDERQMMEFRLSSRATVIEVQRVLDHQAMECVDVLDPERGSFIVLDRSTASQVVRYTRLLAWLTHYRYFSRIENNGVEIMDNIFDDFLMETKKRLMKETVKSPTITQKECLSQNFGFFCGLAQKMAKKRSLMMLRKMDLYDCKAVYRLLVPTEEILRVLEKEPDFKKENGPSSDQKPIPGAQYYSWLRRGRSKAIEKKMNSAFHSDDEPFGVGILGFVVLCPDRMIIGSFSKLKYRFAKKIAKQYFKGMILLQGEKIVDLAKQMAEKKEPLEAEHQDRKQLESMLASQSYERTYKKFPDEPIPMLGGKTPREASRDPLMHASLVELMKIHIKGIDKQKKEKGVEFSLNALLDELNLPELK